MTYASASTALETITVLDLTRVRAGPTCVRQLADWGAKVIKIEMPEEGGSATQTDFSARHEAGFSKSASQQARHDAQSQERRRHRRLQRMVAQADVIVENYRPRRKHRLGIDYGALSAVNPRLIYASISGFGEDGPYRDRPGVDQIAQGMSGLCRSPAKPGRGPCAWAPARDLRRASSAPWGILVALYGGTPGRGNGYRPRCYKPDLCWTFRPRAILMSGADCRQAGKTNHPTGAPTGVSRPRTVMSMSHRRR